MISLVILRGLLAAVAAVLLLAGCGGGDGNGDRLTKDEYQQEVRTLGESAQTDLGDLGASDSPEQIGEELERAKEGFRDLADQLEDVNPPEEIEATHDKLVGGLRQLADDLDEVGASIQEAVQESEESNDPAALFAVFGQLASLESIQTLQEVTSEFEAKGYDVGLEEAAEQAATTTTG